MGLPCLPTTIYPGGQGYLGPACRFNVRESGSLELATPRQSYPRPKVSHPTEPSSGQDGLGEEGNTDPHPVRLCLRTLKVVNHDRRQLHGAPKESELRRITAWSRQYNKQCLRMGYSVRQ
ncbi:hypothetical protein BO83DRAFT_402828 [Aspergillus eucalypticola CBS 122712]|uniref:Uncharacterized protein n=1 Tax=Aspergillus eucalypticola (strain CBS 122712 / IBT 29274) TaxID=1448314 RepID=A0A317UPW7_ASPEC|nr:uncharacterized protein BO83DRAFT_402828 [Aspergillus eucalypticola CBS 122712]PWY64024.1 hypothetical protein BO83DRAFT_402828 [Aspergillus eucalypticola CBS 122712]